MVILEIMEKYKRLEVLFSRTRCLSLLVTITRGRTSRLTTSSQCQGMRLRQLRKLGNSKFRDSLSLVSMNSNGSKSMME